MAWTSFEFFWQRKDSQDHRTNHNNHSDKWESSYQLKMEEIPLLTQTVETKMVSLSKNDGGVNINVARSSCRLKRPPVTRSEDFYG